MNKSKPLLRKRYKLEKFPGKGGWTYARIPEIEQNKHNPFGWVRVRGFIDDEEIKNYHLMPMGNGQLFLPVKASIRKKIGKQEGDWINVVLYPDQEPLEIPTEFRDCLRDEPIALDFFFSLPEGEQKAYLDWIYSAKKDATRINRMASTVNRLSLGLRMHEKPAE